MLNKYNMFLNSKIIVWIIVISILTKIVVSMIFPVIEQPYSHAEGEEAMGDWEILTLNTMRKVSGCPGL